MAARSSAQQEHKYSIGKVEFERRSKMLMDCTVAFEDLFQVFLNYSSSLGLIDISEETARTTFAQNEEYLALRKKKIGETVDEQLKLHAGIQQIQTVIAHLMLFHEEKCVEAAVKFLRAISDAIKILNFDGQTVDMSHHKAVLVKVCDARTDFYAAMRKSLKRSN